MAANERDGAASNKLPTFIKKICIILLTLLIGIITGMAISATCTNVINVNLLNKTNNVTHGETFLVSASECNSLTLKLNSPHNFSGWLDVIDMPPTLSDISTMKIFYDGTLAENDMFAEWVFHLHPNSKLILSSCATTSCTVKNHDHYTITIIKGSDNFIQWIKDHNSDVPVNRTEHRITPAPDCKKNPLIDKFIYDEVGDYYHVFRNLASSDCSITLSANATFDRTEYSNPGESVCKVYKEHSTCTLEELHSKYALVEVDAISEKNVNWSEWASLTLNCEKEIKTRHHDIIAIIVLSAITGIWFIMIIGILIYYKKCRKQPENENADDRPGISYQACNDAGKAETVF